MLASLLPRAPPDVHVWLGGASSVSPLHFDMQHNLLCQVAGYKEAILFDPETCTDALYPCSAHVRASPPAAWHPHVRTDARTLDAVPERVHARQTVGIRMTLLPLSGYSGTVESASRGRFLIYCQSRLYSVARGPAV